MSLFKNRSKSPVATLDAILFGSANPLFSFNLIKITSGKFLETKLTLSSVELLSTIIISVLL